MHIHALSILIHLNWSPKLMITSNSVNSRGTVKFFPLGAPAPNRTVTVNR